jgi:hypothetical protein
MSVSLPPRWAQSTHENIAKLDSGLTSVIAGGAAAPDPWTFYEVLDDYLDFKGKGYPIEYGKFYCVAFNSTKQLMDNPETREWVNLTTIKLQKMLRDFLVEEYRHDRLSQLTREKLTQFAFDSHPKAYDEGGLGKVLIFAPELVIIIGFTPFKEFIPFVGKHVQATWFQVAATALRVGGNPVAAALPAHSGLLGRLQNQEGMRKIVQIQATIRWITSIKEKIDRGELDNLELLNRTIALLRTEKFPDAGTERLAEDTAGRAVQRKVEVIKRYKALLKQTEGFAASEIKKALQDAIDNESPK